MPNALNVQLLLETPTVVADAAITRHALVRLQAEGRPDLQRPPLELVACIDVSGSMEGRKLDEVKRALRALGAELSEQDRLGVTAFSTGVQQALPLVRMNAEGKARLEAAIDGLRTLDSTNMSAGLLGALGDLQSAGPGRADAVRRVLLFTDGHANAGINEGDREAWASLLRTRLGGLSVSWFGFGEDHDADFLAFLADLSRGNSYVARDADAITDAFAKELGGLLGVRALDIKVELALTHGTATLLNDERSALHGERLVISLDDLACEERKDLVVALALPALRGGVEVGLRVLAKWHDVVTGLPQELAVEARLEAAARPSEPNREVLEAMALVFAANAQRRARAFAEQGRLRDAVEVMAEAIRQLEHLGTERAWALARQLTTTLHDYRDQGTYAKNRSKLRSSERTLSKQRASGSELDDLFMSELKRGVVARFKAAPAEPPKGDDGPPPPPRRKRH